MLSTLEVPYGRTFPFSYRLGRWQPDQREDAQVPPELRTNNTGFEHLYMRVVVPHVMIETLVRSVAAQRRVRMRKTSWWSEADLADAKTAAEVDGEEVKVGVTNRGEAWVSSRVAAAVVSVRPPAPANVAPTGADPFGCARSFTRLVVETLARPRVQLELEVAPGERSSSPRDIFAAFRHCTYYQPPVLSQSVEGDEHQTSYVVDLLPSVLDTIGELRAEAPALVAGDDVLWKLIESLV